MSICKCSAGSGALLAALLVAVPAWASGRPVAFASADGVSVAGMFYEASSRPAPVVVLVHMLGRSKDEWVPFAERLQDAGISALAIDLRGHGQSSGNGADLAAMVNDVRAAVAWTASRPGVRPGSVGIVGASLGANLAVLSAVDVPAVRTLALVSPSLDYKGLRLDAAVMKKLSDRALWLASSTEDPYALRTIKELIGESAGAEQRLSSTRAHGTKLLAADQDLAQALVDWLKARLIF